MNWSMNSFVTVYSAIFVCLLGIFSLVQLFGMADQNMTTNEDLRSRWNGNPKNQKSVAIYRSQTNFISRLCFYLFERSHDSHLSKLKNGSSKGGSDDFEAETTGEDNSPLVEKGGVDELSNTAILRNRYGVDVFENGQK